MRDLDQSDVERDAAADPTLNRPCEENLTCTDPKCPLIHGILALVCADCGAIVSSIEDAEKHELENANDDDPHGGWDTIRLDP